MRSSHRFVLLTLTIAMLALVINLSTAESVQAAPPGQSAEERFVETLEEANRSLGGGFTWKTEYGDEQGTILPGYFMSRPYPPGSESTIAFSAGLFWEEIMWIRSVEDMSCTMFDYESRTFHGMEGCITYNNYYYGTIDSILWLPETELQINGHDIILTALSVSEEQDVVVLAEALHQAALNNGLYGPIGEDSLPVDPLEVVPGEYEFSTDTGEPVEIPVIIILGSLGIPIVGAIAGAVLSTVLSGLSMASTSSAAAAVSAVPATTASPKIGNVNPEGLYWSERPWDQAGPGFVPKGEYERTKDFLEKGYKWTNGGWQTPDQIQEFDQLNQNNRDAVAREDAEQRAKMEAERKALQEKKAELEKDADELQAAGNLLDLKEDLETINLDLKKEKVYVLNPYQGDPTVLFHKLNTVKNMVWDNTAAHYTGSQGLTCEGYVRKTHKKVIDSVSKRFPGAKVEQFVIEEKSSVKPEGLIDWLDSLVVDNHILTKVTLPDGSEWAVDFHQKNAGNSPLMRPWPETRRAWKDDYMGDEYMEGLNELK